ncbi:hypothetical protein RHMOL_Rhmol09G0235700 [Rhododendron molle]|uniref:Uncharacterized protein n=1 Tax=Rhododendron molle TaxID=49168 RepID=A0ACC0MGI7_RHOML|nr:hypothetical protein RHMOL_Rhmol09G0235700 [Rhododendron molle]
MVGPKRPQFVLFGSSIVQLSFSNGGWGAILADVYSRKADIVLRGYYGWNSRRALQVLDEVFPKGLDLRIYTYCRICVDLVNAVKLEPFRHNTHYFSQLSTSQRGQSSGKHECYLENSKYFSELVRTNELCRSYSEACVELCEEMGLKVVDLWTAMQRRDDWLTACFTDGVHLSAEGSKVVAEEILKVLKEAEWEPCFHWKSMPTEYGENSPYDLVASDGKTTINPSEWTFHREIQWD